MTQYKKFHIKALTGNLLCFGRIGCLSEDTYIYTCSYKNKSSKKFKHAKLLDLYDHFDVVSYNFDKEAIEVKKATKIYSGIKECYEIELERGRKIIATSDHKFFNENNEEIKVSDLKIGDKLACLTNISGPRLSIVGDKNPARNIIVRNKLSNSNKGKNNPMYGKTFRHSEKTKQVLREKNLGKNNPMYGKHLSEESKKKLSAAFSGEKNPSFGIPRYPKLKFIEKLGHNIRSEWEKNICLLLQKESIEYKYEPKTFKLSNNTSYTPDIGINNFIYIEIKGPLYDWQLNKMKLFKKEYPNLKFVIICNRNIKKLSFADKVLNYDNLINIGCIKNEIFEN